MRGELAQARAVSRAHARRIVATAALRVRQCCQMRPMKAHTVTAA